MNKKKALLITIKSIIVIVTIFAIASVFYGTIFHEQIKNELTEGVLNIGMEVFFLIGFILELIPQYISPYLGLVIALFLEIDIWKACLFILFGGISGSMLGFFLGKKYGTGGLEDFFGREKIEKINTGINKNGKWFVTIAALTPIPYIPILFGSLKMSWKNFIIYGVFPRVLSYIAVTFFLIFINKFDLVSKINIFESILCVYL